MSRVEKLINTIKKLIDLMDSHSSSKFTADIQSAVKTLTELVLTLVECELSDEVNKLVIKMTEITEKLVNYIEDPDKQEFSSDLLELLIAINQCHLYFSLQNKIDLSNEFSSLIVAQISKLIAEQPVINTNVYENELVSSKMVELQLSASQVAAILSSMESVLSESKKNKDLVKVLEFGKKKVIQSLKQFEIVELKDVVVQQGAACTGIWNKTNVHVQLLPKMNFESALSEFKVFQKLQTCPFVSHLFGIISIDDYTGVAYEYPVNGFLHQWIYSTEKSLSASLKFKVINEIALGISFMHNNNIPHGSIKSSNIIMDSFMVPKITNFKSVVREDDLKWNSPEFNSCVELDLLANDCYCFTVLIGEIYTGTLPFNNIPVNQVLQQQQQGIKPYSDDFGMCPQKIKDILDNSWCSNLASRWKISNIVKYLDYKNEINLTGFISFDELRMFPSSLGSLVDKFTIYNVFYFVLFCSTLYTIVISFIASVAALSITGLLSLVNAAILSISLFNLVKNGHIIIFTRFQLISALLTVIILSTYNLFCGSCYYFVISYNTDILGWIAVNIVISSVFRWLKIDKNTVLGDFINISENVETVETVDLVPRKWYKHICNVAIVSVMLFNTYLVAVVRVYTYFNGISFTFPHVMSILMILAVVVQSVSVLFGIIALYYNRFSSFVYHSYNLMQIGVMALLMATLYIKTGCCNKYADEYPRNDPYNYNYTRAQVFEFCVGDDLLNRYLWITTNIMVVGIIQSVKKHCLESENDVLNNAMVKISLKTGYKVLKLAVYIVGCIAIGTMIAAVAIKSSEERLDYISINSYSFIGLIFVVSILMGLAALKYNRNVYRYYVMMHTAAIVASIPLFTADKAFLIRILEVIIIGWSICSVVLIGLINNFGLVGYIQLQNEHLVSEHQEKEELLDVESGEMLH